MDDIQLQHHNKDRKDSSVMVRVADRAKQVIWIQSLVKSLNFYRPQRSCEGYVFTCVCLSTGGGRVPGQVPPGPGTPPWEQVHPLGPGTPPRTRYTPPGTRYTPPGTRYTPLGPGTSPWDQVHPPEPGTPPRTRYTPQDQVHPPGPGTPPETATVADGTHPTGMHSCL